jgi:hypothetical protein
VTLSRRGFLLGVGGAMISLPLLESFPSRARAGGERRRCAVFLRSGNGVQQAEGMEPERFWPTATGTISAATLADRATSVLAPFADRVTIVKGLRRPFGTPACGHAESLPQCLTAHDTTGGTSNAPLALGPSADWRIQTELAGGSDPLTLVAGPTSAYIGPGLSWRLPRERTPAENSPANAFRSLVGLPSSMTPARTSVNDYVLAELNALRTNPRLSSRDRRRLDQHFQAIRDIETRVSCMNADSPLGAEAMAIDNPALNDVRPDVVRLHIRIIAFALSCGRVRAATLQIGEGNDQTQYFVGGSKLPRFHWISHRIQGDGSEGEPIPNAVELHHEVDKIQLGFYRALLEELDAFDTPLGTSLLDDCAAVWFNDLSAGLSHGGRNVPWIVGGGAGGNLRMGQFVDLGGEVTYERILNTILTAVGCTDGSGGPVEDFGSPTLPGGRIPELIA